jgi:signal transduction histidine kinase
LQVRDNGIGFDYERERRMPRGLGLLMMDHCARKAGLGLSFRGRGCGGSTVSAVMVGQGQEFGRRTGGKPHVKERYAIQHPPGGRSQNPSGRH